MSLVHGSPATADRRRSIVARPRRLLTAVAIVAIGVGGTIVPAVPAAAIPAVPTPAPALAAAVTTITSPQLRLQIGDTFPTVVSYTDRTSGARLAGRSTPLASITLNGTAYRTTGSAPQIDFRGAAAHYTLSFPDLPGVRVAASLSVKNRIVEFTIDTITDTDAFRVGTIDIPGHDLLSVSSGDAGAATAFTRLDPDSTRTADQFAAVTAATAADAAPVGAAYAIVNTGQLAATITNNSTVDVPVGQSVDDASRLLHQARKNADGSVSIGLWNGQWTYRGRGASQPSPLPWSKIVVTGDANTDHTVDWQDGAIAYRSIDANRIGSEDVADTVVTHIPFNFASQATHPFLRTLDDVKRISLATDGLGQRIIEKGYASEGHDSAHPDYGGNYNLRAGGLKDLNTLAAQAKKWNTEVGVHVNATEAYPVANNYSDKLVTANPGWDWLDASYAIDQRTDINSGNLARRFQQLRDEADENLDFLYIDVYYSSGWIADSTLNILRGQGWKVGTEWSNRLERSSLWDHWGNDLNYGGATNKGLNSKIIRFIDNANRDVWNADPILGATAIEEFEGWTGHHDYTKFVSNIFARNLPTKFLQQHQIQRWTADEITFTDGVRGTSTGGVRKLYDGDAQVLDGSKYLLPWTDAAGTAKLYHYNATGGSSTWTLPSAFARTTSVTQYRLTDLGRTEATTIPVINGTVTVQAAAGVPYVLYPKAAPAPTIPQWGQGSSVADPGFNAGNLTAWNPTGTAAIARTDRGYQVAALGSGKVSLQQQLAPMPAGKYSASVWVQVDPGQRRKVTLGVNGAGVTPSSAWLDASTAKNQVPSDERFGTYFQRLRTVFEVTKKNGAKPQLTISAAVGTAAVQLDDVRVLAVSQSSKAGELVHEDFEGKDEGTWPFVTGNSSNGDQRTHIAQRHSPYTDAGYRGQLVDDVLAGGNSLKAHEENQGLVYRTVPQSVRFTPGHLYRVSFDYQSALADQYSWVTGADRGTASAALISTPIPQQRTTARFSREFTAGNCGDYWVGLQKLAPGGAAQADLIVDSFSVTDLGESGVTAACATVTVTAPQLVPGDPNTVKAIVTNHESAAITGAKVTLGLPTGWTVGPTTGSIATIEPGASGTASFTVTPPADLPVGSYPATATVKYQVAGEPRTATGGSTLRTIPQGQIPQARMAIADVDSQETDGEDGAATNILDGDPSTIWASQWLPATLPMPHHVTVGLDRAYALDTLELTPRQAGGLNGIIKGYQVFVSADGTSWGTPVAAGDLPSGATVKQIALGGATGKYLKLVVTSAQNGLPFATLAEWNLFGH